jgi:divalent metal cation (Fe/Co/Zn/Cd) transporter
VFGALSGGLSVTVGVLDHSLGVLGTGLAILADLTGSAVLIWRFQTERRNPIRATEVENRASVVISVALATISIVLAVESIDALLRGTHPGNSVIALLSASAAIVVLTPLAYTKRKTAAALSSRALRGDSTLSGIGAATALLALVGLLLYHTLGWWWADRVVALVIAGVAASESYTILRTGR